MLLELLRMSPIGATPLGKKQSLKLMLPILLGHELREDYYCMSWVSNRVVTSCLLITTSPLTDS